MVRHLTDFEARYKSRLPLEQADFGASRKINTASGHFFPFLKNAGISQMSVFSVVLILILIAAYVGNPQLPYFL